MSKYVIIHGQLREISDEELMHWKYTKREKKNGKWVYYYDKDKLGIKRFIDTKITGKAYKQHAYETANKLVPVSQQLFSTKQDRAHAEATSKGYSQTDPKVVELKKKETALSKKHDNMEKEIDEAKENYKSNSMSGAIKTKTTKLKNNIKDGINATKDVLGVDERQKYREAKAEYEINKEHRDTAKARVQKNGIQYSNELDIIESMTKKTRQSAEKYVDSKLEYMNTPLGKVAKVTTTVEDYVSSLFKRKKKTTKSNSSKNVIKENVIKENVIKENVIKENVIKENVIKGDTIEERKKKKK